MEKIVDEVKQHPYLFGGVALLVVVLIFWPKSANNNNTNAANAAYQAQIVAGIAAASQSQTALALGQDQVQAVGINAAAAQAINGQNTQAAVAIANTQAATSQFNTTTYANSLAAKNTAMITSQGQAETFISSLEKAGLAVPDTINVLGAQYTNTPSAYASSPNASLYPAGTSAENNMIVGRVAAYSPSNNNANWFGASWPSPGSTA